MTSESKWYHPKSILDKIFEGSIIIKGIEGALELTAALLLFIISPRMMQGFIQAITQKELVEDKHDFFANLLVNSTSGFSGGGRTFLIIYLGIHAAIKLIAVFGILRNKLWAYPFSLITLGILMIYQVYSIVFVKVSLGLVILTIFDVFVLWLIWREYKIVTSVQRNAALL
jgi:uncharacterized membrane protein